MQDEKPELLLVLQSVLHSSEQNAVVHSVTYFLYFVYFYFKLKCLGPTLALRPDLGVN